ncbi:MATE family efflux transporter [Aurantivibrio plasticivorans]
MSILKQQLPPLLKLAIPAAGAQLSIMLLGIVDTIMVGRLSVQALAASSIANAWLYALLWSGMGLIQGIDPLVSQAHGAGRQDHASRALQRGIVLAIVISVPVICLLLSTQHILLWFQQDATLVTLASTYLNLQLWSVPAFFLFIAFRQYLQGREIVQPMLWIAVIANVVNFIGNYGLIFGHFGFPELGLEGAAIASAVTRAFMFIALLAWCLRFKLIEGVWLPIQREVYRLKEFVKIIQVGLPVATQIGLEILAFSCGTFIAGRLGELSLAAHTVALNIASVSFMIPLGISQGAATRVGNLIGAHHYRQANHAAWVAIVAGGAMMIISAVIFLVFKEQLPRFFSVDASLIQAAAYILPIAAAFQVFDGIQVVCSGVLRGMGKPLPSTLANLFAFWVIGLPVGYWLSIEKEFGLSGLWWSLSLGLALVAVILMGWIALRGPEKYARHFE